MNCPIPLSYLRPLFLAAASICVLGCAQTSPDVYSARSFGTAQETLRGTVESARYVTVQNDGQLGTLIGAALGGVGGSNIGGGTRENIAGAIGGGVLGGIVGRNVEKAATRQDAVEYVVRAEDKKYYTIVQGASPRLAVGDPVFVQLYARDRARITPQGRRN